jgi:hypothetical protein
MSSPIPADLPGSRPGHRRVPMVTFGQGNRLTGLQAARLIAALALCNWSGKMSTCCATVLCKAKAASCVLARSPIKCR